MITATVALAAGLSLSACGGGDDKDGETKPSTSAPPTMDNGTITHSVAPLPKSGDPDVPAPE